MPGRHQRVNHRTPTKNHPPPITLFQAATNSAAVMINRLLEMPHAARLLSLVIAASAMACGGSSSSPPSTKPAPDVRPLGSLVASGAIVTPTYAVRTAPELDWSTRLGPTREILRTMDDDIASALAARGLKSGWILPPDLALSFKRNPTYASDPYALAEEPLRASSFTGGSRLAEPLASQLRTMIALHENARVVLLPVELRFERADSSAAARATLRLALVDPRFSEARWVGEVRSDTASADPHVLTSAVARRLADLIVGR